MASVMRLIDTRCAAGQGWPSTVQNAHRAALGRVVACGATRPGGGFDHSGFAVCECRRAITCHIPSLT